MTFDWTFRVTDIVMIFAVIAGPILAVAATEVYRRRKELSDRRELVFRTLMATRSATLSPNHIENLNMVDTLFHGSRREDRAVVDAWKVYLQHLGDGQYAKESWGARKADLMHDLLHKMSVAVGYSFELSHIKSGAYYPDGYQTAEWDWQEVRQMLVQILKGAHPLRVTVTPSNDQAEAQSYLATQAAFREVLSGHRPIPIVMVQAIDEHEC
jgi:hypothetical protein